MLLWAASVAVFALTLYLLARVQLETLRTWEMTGLAQALREGNLERAEAFAVDNIVLFFPTSVVTQFALLGLAVIATAWLGRRAIAVALPFVVFLTSFASAFWGEGASVPHPLGEYDSSLWGSLVMKPAMGSYTELPLWPLILGSIVQLVLLLMPLIAAPAVKPLFAVRDVAARALIPALALAILALAMVPAPSSSELYRAPVVAIALAFFVVILSTGRGPLAVRLTAAIVVPTAIAPIVLSSALDDTGSGVAFTLATAAASIVVLLISFGLARLRSHLAAREGADVVAAGV